MFAIPPRSDTISVVRSRDELEHVQVAGEDHDLEPRGLGLAHERGDRVVRLEPLLLVDRDPERLDDLAHLRDLVPHVVRHPRPGRLVLGVAVVAERRLGQVEGDRDRSGFASWIARRTMLVKPKTAVTSSPFDVVRGWSMSAK